MGVGVTSDRCGCQGREDDCWQVGATQHKHHTTYEKQRETNMKYEPPETQNVIISRNALIRHPRSQMIFYEKTCPANSKLHFCFLQIHA